MRGAGSASRVLPHKGVAGDRDCLPSPSNSNISARLPISVSQRLLATVTERKWKECFGHMELKESHIKPVGYGEKPVEGLGEYEVDFGFQGNVAKGARNLLADFLLRLPRKCVHGEEDADEDDVLVCSLECRLEDAVMESEWRESCGRDEQIKAVMEGILQGLSTCKSVRCETYKQVFEELYVVNNILMYAGGGLVVLEGIKNKILTLGHEGHIACDVELLNKPVDESTMVDFETWDTLQKSSPCDIEMLSKALEESSKEKHGTKDMVRKTLSRIKMFPSKYRDYVLFA
ncbi:hypothetical protein NDU88_002796 [Pleurodeles waltl]|uniref:Uncharacterized protein n=1 Tax=Pleurodeles waltl TaxID=8319 RepID=A0AAV7WQJ5_PLEWA|nr:hypothetical protein NDU88_002796 [Pleurodeles waltl]